MAHNVGAAVAAAAGRLVEARTGQVVAERAEMAAGLWGQFIGRIGREAALGDRALGLPKCPQVHTALLRAAIDVAFCAADGTVLRVVTLAPWHISPFVAGTATAWETRAGLLTGVVTPGASRLVFEER